MADAYDPNDPLSRLVRGVWGFSTPSIISGIADAARGFAGRPQANALAPGTRRQPERPLPPAIAQSLGGYAPTPGEVVSPSIAGGAQPPAAAMVERMRAPQARGGTGQITDIPGTNAYAQGEVVAPSIAGGAPAPQSGPATAVANPEARIRQALLRYQMGVGGLSGEEQGAESQSEQAKYIGGLAPRVTGKRWGDNLSRAAAIAGSGYLEGQAQKSREEIARQQKIMGLKALREIELLRGGEDPNNPRQRTLEE